MENYKLDKTIDLFNEWFRVKIFLFSLFIPIFMGCYSYRWTNPKLASEFVPPPEEISKIFSSSPDGTLSMEMVSPGKKYEFDPGEKDSHYSSESGEMRFHHVTLSLHPQTLPGQILADIAFEDQVGTKISTEPVDLLRLIPEIDSRGEMQYLELLLEEFHRFGLSFRREHDEFQVQTSNTSSDKLHQSANRSYRMSLTNNCLDPTKWEMKLVSQDYHDFQDRLNSHYYLNQNKTLAHSWFYLNKTLYAALMRIKNPGLEIDAGLANDFDGLADKAKNVIVDFNQLRSLKKNHDVKLIELGHLSKRAVLPLTSEQYYKWDAGIFVNRNDFYTYAQLLQKPVRLAQFTGRGFYTPDSPKVFDYGWARSMDTIRVNQIDLPDTDCFAEIEITGDDSPYALTLGNIDLALLDEQRYNEIFFGINPYPLSRRNNPSQNTIRYSSDSVPNRIKTYFMMTEKDTGKWVNNIDKGIELAYLGWESIEKNKVEIYLLSYERITPVWMAKIELNDEMVDRIRVRRKLYDY